eukprot:1161093-Pelagomonas_calceolata.AAC.2
MLRLHSALKHRKAPWNLSGFYGLATGQGLWLILHIPVGARQPPLAYKLSSCPSPPVVGPGELEESAHSRPLRPLGAFLLVHAPLNAVQDLTHCATPP